MSDEITELFGPGLAETRVIRNGIDAARWPFAKRRPRTGPPHLVFVGRLEYEKGIHDLIAAMPRIRRHHPGTTLTVAGTGTQQTWLVQQARKHKVLKATTFVGHLDHEQLVRLLHTADAAVLPSHYEPFGIVALEAAATGIPLVTSDVGGLGEAVIDGQTGTSFARAISPAWPRRYAPCSITPIGHNAWRSPHGNALMRPSPGTPLQTRPPRSTWPPNVVSANLIGAAPSSNTPCPIARSSYPSDPSRSRSAPRPSTPW